MVGVGLVVLVAVVVAIAAASSSTRQLTWDQLQPGDCLQGSDLGLGTTNHGLMWSRRYLVLSAILPR
jgi:hypothetical protein